MADARRVASGIAAWQLGMHLIDMDDRAAAVPVLREALVALSDIAHADEVREVLALLAYLQSGLPFDRNPLGVFEGKSKADLILDSLEFGRGDIDRSLHFLEEIRRTEPQNLAARDALNYVEGLSAAIEN